MAKNLQINRGYLASSGGVFESVEQLRSLLTGYTNDEVRPYLGEPTVFFVRNGNGIKLVLGIGKYNDLSSGNQRGDGKADAYELFDVVGIEDRIGAVESGVADLNSGETTLTLTLQALSDKVDGIDGRLEAAESGITAIEVPVKGVASGETMLSLSNEGKLHVGFTIDQSENGVIKFIGLDGHTVVDTIDTEDFIKDSFLDSVEVITRPSDGERCLRFIFNTADGQTTTEIPLSQLAKEYVVASGSTGYLDIRDFNVSAKVDVAGGLASYETAVTIDNKYSGITNEIKGMIGDQLPYDESGNTMSITHKIAEMEREMAKDGELEELQNQFEELKNTLKNSLKIKAVKPDAKIQLRNVEKYVVAGTKKTFEAGITYVDGKYVYPNETEVAANCKPYTADTTVFDESEPSNPFNIGSEITVRDHVYRVKTVIDYPEGDEQQGLFGGESVQIPAGQLERTSENFVQGYYPVFYGSFTDNEFQVENAESILTRQFVQQNMSPLPYVIDSAVTFGAGKNVFVILVPYDERFETLGNLKGIVDNSDYGFNIIDSFSKVPGIRLTIYDGDPGMSYAAYCYSPGAAIDESMDYKLIY